MSFFNLFGSEPGNAYDHPHIVMTYFWQWTLDFLQAIRENNWFGKVRGYVVRLEFQKRGLPHVHVLLWSRIPEDLDDPATSDKYILAELPREGIFIFCWLLIWEDNCMQTGVPVAEMQRLRGFVCSYNKRGEHFKKVDGVAVSSEKPRYIDSNIFLLLLKNTIFISVDSFYATNNKHDSA